MQHDWNKYFDTESEYWKKVQKIYEENDNYPKVIVSGRNLHHKFPRSFSKKDGVDIDNDDDNLVSLSLANHFRVHYYLWKCCKKGYRGMMALAFQFMRKKAIKYASDETIEELAKDYENVMKDACDYKSECNKGKKLSEETKAKVSVTMKGHLVSRETRAKISEAQKGKKFSEEHKRKLSEAGKGRKLSEEHIANMSAALKGRPATNKGKHLSDEQKAKMSAAMKGKNKGKHWKLIDGKRVWY